jgi:peptidoglycan/LPS O-acetylase OafA/YrhL
MVGGFILVAFLLCMLLAWPGQRRWPIWLIAGTFASTCAALTLAVASPPRGAFGWAAVLAVLLAVGFVATAVVRELRDPLR